MVVGNGSPRQAARFRDHEGIDFPLFTDPTLKSHKAANLARSVATTFGLGVVKNAVRAFGKGFRQGRVQGDPWQQGGVFVIAPGDRVLFEQRSRTGGDHPDPTQLLAALNV